MKKCLLRYTGKNRWFKVALREIKAAGFRGEQLFDMRAMSELQKRLNGVEKRDRTWQILHPFGGDAA